MGWFIDGKGLHEGYLVAMVDDDLPFDRAGACSVLPRFQSPEHYPLRELGRKDGGELGAPMGARHAASYDVHNVQLACVACACGWRSRVFRVAMAIEPSTWRPYGCQFGGHVEHNAREVWRAHVASDAQQDGYALMRLDLDSAIKYVETRKAART
jgi:hypothetical protein